MWFPQVSTGTLVQLPVRRSRRWRNIENQLEGGESITLPDPASGRVEWRLSLRDLTDVEAGGLRDLFTAVNGSYGFFGFADPLANLLAWSNDLSRPDWQPGLLSTTKGAADPEGGNNAWTVFNSAAGPQSLMQNLGLPASYIACFSVWLRCSGTETVALVRDGVQVQCTVGPSWKRAYVSAGGSGESANFGLVLEAGQAVEAFGFQAEVQPYPSKYKSTRRPRGIYGETRFAGDELNSTNTAPGLTACEITLVSRI